MNIENIEEIFEEIILIPIIKEIAQTPFFLKLAEITHRITYKYRDEKMTQAIERFKKCDNKKPKSQIKKEMAVCKKFWGCHPLHYYRYNLYKKDKNLSESDLLDYIPEFFFYYLFLPFYNPKKYKKLLEDKNFAEQLLSSQNIPQPYTLCKLINNRIYNNRLIEIKFNNIVQDLSEKKCEKIFVKPLTGRGGHGIYIFNKNYNGQYLTKDCEIFNKHSLKKIGKKDDYIVQVGIEQDKVMSALYPHSVNTIKINTENKKGNVRIINAVLRCGRSGAQVDNADQGGIFFRIEIDTGKTGYYATSMQGKYFEKHPDTNITFNRFRIPKWKEIKEFVIECTKKIPQPAYLGWDIALTKNGPIVLEVNYGPFSLDGLQICYGGVRKIFGIDNPEFYWKNKGKEYENFTGNTIF